MKQLGDFNAKVREERGKKVTGEDCLEERNE